MAGLPELRQAHEMNPNCAVTPAWLGHYEGFHGNVARGVPLAEAAGSATPLILGAIACAGAGRLEQEEPAFARVAEIAPKLAEARLAGRWLTTTPDYLARAHTFFRIAAGLGPPEGADSLR